MLVARFRVTVAVLENRGLSCKSHMASEELKLDASVTLCLCVCCLMMQGTDPVIYSCFEDV